jgi:hypothetical protein
VRSTVGVGSVFTVNLAAVGPRPRLLGARGREDAGE